MKKWIRWRGIVSFVLIVVLGLFIWYLLADRLITDRIEESGEYIFGAQVDVGKADLTVFPTAITVDKLLVANPNSPMKNLLDIERVKINIDKKYLFDRKLIINEMVVDGIKFNTDRETSGRIEETNSIYEQLYDEFVLPILDLSNIKTKIDNEEIESLNRFNDVLDDIKSVKTEWEYIYNTLPTTDDLLSYRESASIITNDIKQNRVAGLVKHAKEIKRLKTEIGKEIEKINYNKKAMLIDIDSLESKKVQSIKFVNSDIIRLRDKYIPNFGGIDNFSKYFFTDAILKRTVESFELYSKIQPYFKFAYKQLKNGYIGNESILYDGVDVLYPDFDPQPIFLIDSVKLNIDYSKGDIIGKINNITNQQNINGKPITFNFESQDFNIAESINITGYIDRIRDDNSIDELNVGVENQLVKSNKYYIDKDWSINILHGIVDKNIGIRVSNGNVSGNIRFDYNKTSIIGEYTGKDNRIINTINAILTDINNFYIDVSIGGTTDDFTLNITSSLDREVSDGVKNLIKAEAKKIEDYIVNTIDEKKKEYLVKVNDELDKIKLDLNKVEDILEKAKKILIELP